MAGNVEGQIKTLEEEMKKAKTKRKRYDQGTLG